jgi:glycine/D-amino acid oxidase-like deaminating enzyme
MRYIDAPHGFGVIKYAGRLDMQKLTFSYSGFLQKQQFLRKEKFNFDKLHVGIELVSYEDLTAEKIIFCEGASASRNPYFENLKFKHSKGEILELKIPDLHLEDILSSNVFVMPVGNHHFKVGATYSWDHLDEQTTEQARTELLYKLKNVATAPSEIIDQKAGIRPTMHDRKPVIGLHPNFPQIGIFNGLGPKGALLGPYLASQFAQSLCNLSTSILPEADIKRYFRRK